MSAAVALALALLVAPGPPRHRLHRRSLRATPRRPMPVAPALVVMLLTAATITPPGVVVALGTAMVTAEARRRRRVRLRRRAAEAAALQGALDVLVGELRIGAHPVAAFEAAAAEVDTDVAIALRTVAARARMGADVAAGLCDAARRSSLPAHWQRLAVCWRLAHAHGLAIATLIQAAQRDIVARERFSAQVTAGMAGARATAAVLAGLPVLGIGLGQLIGADPLRFLMADGVGQWLLVAGIGLSCAGLRWSERIIGRVTR